MELRPIEDILREPLKHTDGSPVPAYELKESAYSELKMIQDSAQEWRNCAAGIDTSGEV